MDGKIRFFSELKRRNVLRAAALYVGAVWVLSQGISQLSGPLGLANWVTVWFLIAAVIAFPFWLAFAWLFEFTPQGFKRESEVQDSESITHSTARKLDFAIIGVLVVAVVLLASGYFVHRHEPMTGAPPEAAPFNPPADSLVVLPFRNLNDDPRQQYFSDGITEELTDALGQNTGLRVIAWDTASRLRDSAQPAHAVGQSLNVANVLHGSIQREGDQVRITAELVDTRSGLQMWSQHYDGSFADIFKVQDEVSQAIAGALKVKFAQAAVPKGGTTSPAAHELVLRGRALMHGYTAASLASARRDFEQAAVLDPDYADAHALLSRVLLELTERSDLPIKTVLPMARAEAKKAVALDPGNADAWVALGSAESSSDPPDLAKARADFQKALTLDPSNAGAHLNYGNVVPLEQALAESREAVRLDPDNETAWNNYVANAQDLGDWGQMIQACATLLKLDPDNVDSAFGLAFAHQQLHQYDQMVAAFDLVKPPTPVDQEQVNAGRLTYQALRNPALRTRALVAVNALARHQSNQDVAGNLLQLYLALGETRPTLDLLENSCPAYPVGCSDLAVSPQYQALHGNPRFEVLARKYTTASVQ